MTSSPRALAVLAVGTAAALVLAGCSSASPAADAGRIQVVASTDVYGQIAAQIGGDAVDVTSLVTAQDPHDYEPSARDQLAVREADLVIENGGGFDYFVDGLIEASGTEAVVLTAVEFSPHWTGGAAHDDSDDHADEDDHADDDDHGHEHIEGFNEHVWYDTETVHALAVGIASDLEVLAPDEAAVAAIESNLARFLSELDAVDEAIAAANADHVGATVFVTEPVPLYLTEAIGLVNLAPADFTEAVEEGQDVPPAILLESLDLLRDGSVDVVIANAQTGGAETEQVIAEAESLGIPVVEFTETLPEGQTYTGWMDANVNALREALES